MINFILFISKLIKSDRFFINTSFLYALFIFGQRWMTGTDFPNYLEYYLVDFQGTEPAYRLLQNVLSSNGFYFGILIFIVFFITLFNNYRFILKLDKHVVLILYLYVFSEIFFAQMSQIRQFVAISFFVNSYYFSYQKQYLRSGINIILALLFHDSAVFLIPFLFIKLNLNKIKTLYLLLLSGVFPLLDPSLLLNLDIFSRYSHYLDGVFDVNLSVFHYFKFYILLAVILLFVWYMESFELTKLDQMIFNGLIFNMLIYGFSFQFAPLIRASFYFKIFEIIFLIYYHKKIKKFSLKVVQFLVVVLFIGIYAGLGITDPYDISRYEFRPLRITENRSEEVLWHEVDTFYE